MLRGHNTYSGNHRATHQSRLTIGFSEHNPISVNEQSKTISCTQSNVYCIHYFVNKSLTSGLVSAFNPTIESSQDYYPFGSLMPGRNWNAGNYRFGFNGKEKDDELKSSGNSYDFGARIYDPRIGRWLSVDPKADKRSWLSPYNYCQNNPMNRTDPTGALDEIDPTTEKNVKHLVDPSSPSYNKPFAEKYDILKNDKNAVYSFNKSRGPVSSATEKEYGNISYNGKNSSGQYLIGINFTEKTGTSGLSTLTPLFEETYHAFQFSKGDYGFDAVSGGTFALDAEDEGWAKLFAAQNTPSQKYGYDNGILKSYNKNGINGVKDFLINRSNVYNNMDYNPINVVDFCNKDPNISKYAPNYFAPNGQSIFTQIIMQKP